MMNAMIDFLWNNADPSIRLRVKRDICRDITREETRACLSAIVSQRNMRNIFDAQREDGWIGDALHGQSEKHHAGMFDNMEVGLRYLCEKGLPSDHPVIRRAVAAFSVRNRSHPVYGGDSGIEDHRYPCYGPWYYIAPGLIRAGCEDARHPAARIDVPRDIEASLRAFRSVLHVQSPDDVIATHRGTPVFRDGVEWPCIYDLRILAHSHSWRTEANRCMLSGAVRRLFSFPQSGPAVYTRIHGALRGPCMPLLHVPVLGEAHDAYRDAAWFDRMELLARCGVVCDVPQLRSEVDALRGLIGPDGICRAETNRTYFRSWSPYFGLSLEEDWKRPIRRRTDITFRALLILYHARCETA